ncbi:MAG: glycosyltransferase family 39 protein [candidate division WOR-3 bacterium]|nr:MAG: glycosyltransferase family 39 protein [candidate division WOR-3 bacterium]
MRPNHPKSWSIVYAGFVVIVMLVTVWSVGLDRPCYHDECHFVETVELFVRDMGLSTFQTYNEMSTPLPFILYALWGRIFGFHLHVLRLFSLLVAVITYALLYRLLNEVIGSKSIVFASAAFMILNPYMIGLSIFVYTDMLTLLFVIMSCFALLHRKPVLLFVSLAGALLCRQFTLFLIVAMFIFFMLVLSRKRDRSVLAMIAACAGAIVPYAALIVLWRGLIPDNAVRTVYLDAGLSYNPSHLILYMAMFCVYLLPFVIVNWRLYRELRVLVASFVLAWGYWLFPVSASPYTVMIDRHTTGFFHRALKNMLINDLLVHTVYFLLFMAALPIIWCIVRDLYWRIHRNNIDLCLFLDLSIICYLIIMPFAYMAWEKYFLLILPFGILRFLLMAFPAGSRASQTAQGGCA